MPQTALVTGATGLLGRQVLKAFDAAGWTAKGTGFSRADGNTIVKVDLGSAAEVEGVLDSVRPDVVVHCAANRFPDKVDQDPEGTRALNIVASKQLAALCAARNVLLVYISTDYVFAGRPGEAPYEADAEPSPTNLYGQTKLDGERAVLAEYTNAALDGLAAVLRVPVLYGHAHSPAESAVNTLQQAVDKAAVQGAAVSMDHWSLRFPTNTEDVARVLKDIATKYLATPAADRPGLPRVMQFSSEDKMTKYEICQTMAAIKGVDLAGMTAQTEGNDPNAAVQRPYDCHLSTRVLRDLGIDVSTRDFKQWWTRELSSA